MTYGDVKVGSMRCRLGKAQRAHRYAIIAGMVGTLRFAHLTSFVANAPRG